jgi:hypothetical protein
MDGVTFAGQDARLALVGGMLASAGSSGSTGLAARVGVRYGIGNPLAVLASAGMNITVNSGYVYTQGSAAIDAGIYATVLDGTATLTVAAADPTNPRIDTVIVQLVDTGTSSSTYVVTLQTGTPAASPVAPTLPANSVLLAQIAVAAGATSIVSGNITDKRPFIAAAGGIIPCASSSTYPTSGEASQYIHDLTTGRLRVLNGSGGSGPAKTGAWAPIYAIGVSNVLVSSTSVPVQVLAGTVTVDGVDVPKITCSWTSWSESSTAHGGDTLLHQIYRDGALAYQWYANVASGWPTGGRFPGGSFVFFDNNPAPAAGTHTFAWSIISATSGATFRLDAGAQTQLSMSIEPAPR